MISDTIYTGLGAAAMGNFISTYPKITTGLSSLAIEPANISVYPNPFTSQTTIAFSEDQMNTVVKIEDTMGKEIKSINFTGRQLTLDKGEMSNGIYFLQLTDANRHVVTRKLALQ